MKNKLTLLPLQRGGSRAAVGGAPAVFGYLLSAQKVRKAGFELGVSDYLHWSALGSISTWSTSRLGPNLCIC